MELDFHPPHLETAGQVPLLRKLLAEVSEEPGMLRVVQAWSSEPLRLIVVAPNHRNVSLSVPGESLREGTEADWRAWLKQLTARSAGEREKS